LETRTDVPNYTFKPEPIGEAAIEILGTTNLVNGIFTDESKERIGVFLAKWHAGDGQRLAATQHTPDLCWVGVGWTPENLGQPESIILRFEGRDVPFECRVFKSPDSSSNELVVWCTLIGGRVMPEAARFRSTSDVTKWNYVVFRGKRFFANAWRELKQRSATKGDKQFVRCSVRLHGGWSGAVKQLQAFGPRWLKLSDFPGRSS
ncbi:MAG: hypothetical protein ABI651_00695, partial [Verrucomicrobiota bacterium]